MSISNIKTQVEAAGGDWNTFARWYKNELLLMTLGVDEDFAEDAADSVPGLVEADIQEVITQIEASTTVTPLTVNLTDDVNQLTFPVGTKTIYVDSDHQNNDIRGIEAQSDGYTLYIINIGTNRVRLRGENSNAVAEDRITKNVTVQEGEGICLTYVAPLSRWLPVVV